jgi:alkanesulfonate monooxygenase SsuD/methylene tetrahydromethanopterin reductase-like flavin-dependent oxidoreductase (luciferase family)
MNQPTFGWIVQTIARENARLETLYTDNARYIDQLRGVFTTLWFDDHFQKTRSPILESWTSLSYFAAKFPEFMFGTLVLSHSYRNPALTAKMMATIQFLSGGRYIAGIGAGWKEDEYLAYGYPFPSNKVRLEELEETVQIFRLMWTQSPATFVGKHYQIRNADCEPLPQPPIPLLIGGGGEKVTLRLVAQYADWFNVTFTDPPTYAHKLEVLKRHCAEVGRNFDEITKSLWAYINFNDEGHPMRDQYGRYIISGTPQQVTETLRSYAAMGCSHFMLRFVDYPQTEMLEIFKQDVLPKIRP